MKSFPFKYRMLYRRQVILPYGREELTQWIATFNFLSFEAEGFNYTFAIDGTLPFQGK